jgi:hypothetical protein
MNPSKINMSININKSVKENMEEWNPYEDKTSTVYNVFICEVYRRGILQTLALSGEITYDSSMSYKKEFNQQMFNSLRNAIEFDENTPISKVLDIYEECKYNYPDGFAWTYISNLFYDIILDELLDKCSKNIKTYTKGE